MYQKYVNLPLVSEHFPFVVFVNIANSVGYVHKSFPGLVSSVLRSVWCHVRGYMNSIRTSGIYGKVIRAVARPLNWGACIQVFMFSKEISQA